MGTHEHTHQRTLIVLKNTLAHGRTHALEVRKIYVKSFIDRYSFFEAFLHHFNLPNWSGMLAKPQDKEFSYF